MGLDHLARHTACPSDHMVPEVGHLLSCMKGLRNVTNEEILAYKAIQLTGSMPNGAALSMGLARNGVTFPGGASLFAHQTTWSQKWNTCDALRCIVSSYPWLVPLSKALCHTCGARIVKRVSALDWLWLRCAVIIALRVRTVACAL